MRQRIEVRAARRPWLSADFVRAMLAGHSALGLGFAALIYIVCFTGTVAVFLNEFKRWEQPDAPVAPQGVTADAVAAAFAAAHARSLAEGGADAIYIAGPGPISPRFEIHYDDHHAGVEGEWLADGNGSLITPLRAPWSEFLAELHTALHLPRAWGTFLVGLVGVVLLSSLISGLLSHPRIFKDAFALRWGGSRRLQEADLHNRLGVWGLPFHLVVSLTGALLGLSTLIIGILALAAYDGDSERAFAEILGPMARADEAPAPLPDIAAMIRQIEATVPHARFVSARAQHIGAAGQMVHLGMRTPGQIAMANTYYFDGQGTRLGDGGLETGGIGQQILGMLQPLHIGWFGGMAVKVAYGLLGAALTLVTYSGVTIWLARRRDKGQPAPGWETAWSALGWGQPLALATTAGASLVMDTGALLPIYLTTMAAAFAAAFATRHSIGTPRLLRLATAVAFGTVAILHTTLWASRGSDPMATAINAILVGCALILATSAFHSKWKGV